MCNGGEHEKVIMKIKTLLAIAPALIILDYHKPFKLHLDASDNGVGTVLLQESAQNVDLPIS